MSRGREAAGRADVSPTGVDAVVRALYHAYNTTDAAAASALYAPDGCHLEVATGSRREGPEAVRQGLTGLLEAFPDARWTERARVVSDGRAAITYVLTGTLRARFGPFEPDGQRLELNGVHVLRVGAEGIACCEDYWDASTFGRQMQRR